VFGTEGGRLPVPRVGGLGRPSPVVRAARPTPSRMDARAQIVRADALHTLRLSRLRVASQAGRGLMPLPEKILLPPAGTHEWPRLAPEWRGALRTLMRIRHGYRYGL
jgi:hypothetical protein